MMFKTSTIIGLCLLLTAFAPAPSLCKKEPIVGKWRWIKTSCCFMRPKITTPDSCGCTKELDIYKNGNYMIVKNGDTTEKGAYTLKKGLNVLDPKDQTPLIRLGDGVPAIYSFLHDTLIVNRGYMDLETEYYVRKR